jgi:hypothetical protein
MSRTLSMEQVLAIKHPEHLFTGNAATAKEEYHKLVKAWHPDICHDIKAPVVFAHVAKLYREAEIKLANGNWGKAYLHVVDKAGTSHSIEYHTARLFELGSAYIGRDTVTYVLDEEHEDLWANGTTITQKFPFPSSRMSAEMSRYLPDPPDHFQTRDGDCVAIFSKPSRLIRLQDALEHYGGRMPPAHVAWILSRLHNFACYLHTIELCHNEISPDTVYIDPAAHQITVLGGWWYATPAGAALKQVSKRTHGVLPWKVKAQKRASRKTDMELIRATGLELLGSGAVVPEAMGKYLKEIAQKSAITEYKVWDEVLVKSFGAKRFTVMDVKPEQIYPIG